MMNLVDADSVLSESMVLTDHEKQPMTIRIVGEIATGTAFNNFSDSDARIRVVATLINRITDLSGHFSIHPESVVFSRIAHVSLGTLDELAKKVWSLNHLRQEEFMKSYVDALNPPLFRLWFREGKLIFLCHHALVDGRSALRLFFAIIEAANEIWAENEISLLSKHEEKKVRLSLNELFQKAKRIVSAIRLIRYILKNPPVLLGAKNKLFGEGPTFFTDQISETELRMALDHCRKRNIKISTYGLLVASLHLALHENLQSQISQKRCFAGNDRISTMAPCDLRGREGPSAFISNLSVTPSIDSTSGQRADKWKLLGHVQYSLKTLKQNAFSALGVLELLRLVGAFKSARKVKLETGLPRRAKIDGDKFWKFMDTAMITYMGKISVPLKIRHTLKSCVGFPPTIPPWGLSICCLLDNNILYFGITADNTTISSQDARKIIDALKKNLINYAKD